MKQNALLHDGTYEVGVPIASGGMGAVWRGRHLASGQEIAFKFLRNRPHAEDGGASFLQEVQALMRLDHPNIVRIYDFGLADVAVEHADVRAGQPYLVMELVDGRDAASAPFPSCWRELQVFLVVLLDALAHAHARTVFHLDVKPPNVLLPRDGDVTGLKLTDFGIAHDREPLGSVRDLGHLRRFSGTPSYSAPEQFTGAWRDFGPWTDLYALGCTAWELATGELPFDGPDVVSIAMRHINDAPGVFEPRFAVPDALVPWLRKLLVKDPRQRFRSAARAAAELARLPEEAPGSSSRSSTDTAPLPEPTRSVPAGEASTWTLGLDLAMTMVHPTRIEARPFAPHVVSELTATLPVPEGWRREDEAGVGPGLRNPRLHRFGAPPFVGRERARDLLWECLRDCVQDNSPRIALLRGPTGIGKSRLAEWVGERCAELGVASFVKVPLRRAVDRVGGMQAMLEALLATWGLEAAEVYERAYQRFASSPREAERAGQMAAAVVAVLRPGADDETPREPLFSWRERTHFMRMLLDALTAEGPLVLLIDDIEGAPEISLLASELLNQQSSVPVLILLTLDDDAAVEPAELAQVQSIAALESTTIIELQPLADSESAAMLAGVQVEVDEVERVLATSHGSPLEILLRLGSPAAVDGWEALWRWRVEQALESQADPGAAHEVLLLLACLGDAFSEREWEIACRRSDVRTPRSLLQALVRDDLLGPTYDGWTFTHRTLALAFARRARSEGKWQQIHRAWSEEVAAVPTLDPTREKLAHHLVEAGELAEALPVLFAAGEAASFRGDTARASTMLSRYKRVLEMLGNPPDTQLLQALLMQARIAWFEAAYEQMRTFLQHAQRLCDATTPPHLRAAVLRGLANLAEQVDGALEEGLRLTTEALEILTGDDPRMVLERRISHGSLGGTLFALGRPEEALIELNIALEGLDEGHDVDPRLLIAVKYRGDVLAELGRFDEAERALRRATEQGRQIRARSLCVACIGSLADVAFQRGDFERARQYNQEALDQASFSYPGTAALSHLNLASIALAQGRDDDARVHLNAAVAGIRWGVVTVRSSIVLVQAVMAVREGDLEQFGSLVDELGQIWERPVRHRRESQTLVRAMRGRLPEDVQLRLEQIVEV